MDVQNDVSRLFVELAFDDAAIDGAFEPGNHRAKAEIGRTGHREVPDAFESRLVVVDRAPENPAGNGKAPRVALAPERKERVVGRVVDERWRHLARDEVALDAEKTRVEKGRVDKQIVDGENQIGIGLRSRDHRIVVVQEQAREALDRDTPDEPGACVFACELRKT